MRRHPLGNIRVPLKAWEQRQAKEEWAKSSLKLEKTATLLQEADQRPQVRAGGAKAHSELGKRESARFSVKAHILSLELTRSLPRSAKPFLAKAY